MFPAGSARRKLSPHYSLSGSECVSGRDPRQAGLIVRSASERFGRVQIAKSCAQTRNFVGAPSFSGHQLRPEATVMHGIIYLVGLIVVIMAILSFFGLR